MVALELAAELVKTVYEHMVVCVKLLGQKAWVLDLTRGLIFLLQNILWQNLVFLNYFWLSFSVLRVFDDLACGGVSLGLLEARWLWLGDLGFVFDCLLNILWDCWHLPIYRQKV